MPRDCGIVKWFDEGKGWGFITPDTAGKKDIFVHKSNLETLSQTLEEGDRVEFDLIEGPKGLEAIHVRLIELA